jgi:hypothetical protein
MKGAAKIWLSVLVGFAGLLAAGRADAQTCMFDTDCPGTECGGQVCISSSGSGHCADANTEGASGLNDGWCLNDTAHCKCASLGAVCNIFCSFTIPPTGTGGTTGGGGAGGSTGTAGSGTGGSAAGGTSGGGGGDGGCRVAGAPSLGGSLGIALLALALMRRRGRRRAG